MPKPDKPGTTPADRRKAKLAAELRANLQKRKVQARSRRAGAADERPGGLATEPSRDAVEDKPASSASSAAGPKSPDNR